jgi:hypothetical protein
MNRFVAPVRIAICVTALWAPSAHAQTSRPVQPGRVEVSIGPVWIGRASFGSRDGTETTGSGGTFRLFTTSSELASAGGLEARFAVRLTRAFEAELRGSFSEPELRITAESDVEPSNAPKVASDAIRQFIVGGAIVWYPSGPRLGARARLFVSGGAAYLRQLENRGTLIVTGSAYDVGGGMKYALKSGDSGRLKAIGARFDVGAKIRARGIALDDRAHTSPFLAASVYLRF